MQKSKNNAYNPKEKGPLFARSISQTGAFNYTRFFFPLTVINRTDDPCDHRQFDNRVTQRT
ncbi:hypothetical protein EROP_31050 [Erysipelotrichaceae bacterium OPF54]|nr:hypothetical protein EROP_02460 [Erysipelotrichaceae bacterium OPF54]GJM59412.1 hypothetical protein EROP_31050 [Erysipelotrichaceae bacterium OPF54]